MQSVFHGALICNLPVGLMIVTGLADGPWGAGGYIPPGSSPDVGIEEPPELPDVAVKYDGAAAIVTLAGFLAAPS